MKPRRQRQAVRLIRSSKTQSQRGNHGSDNGKRLHYSTSQNPIWLAGSQNTASVTRLQRAGA
jgi:hypothetical protein